MITQIDISNFRSIKHQSIPLKKLNVLYGPNGSGKSSVMYAPYVLRNFLVKPNQRLNSLFNFGFINLGGFENIVRNQDPHEAILVNFTISLANYSFFQKLKASDIEYRLILHESFEQMLFFVLNEQHSVIFLDLPYTLTEKETIKIDIDEKSNIVTWNGLVFEGDNGPHSQELAVILNNAANQIKNIEIISVKRGFFNPIFNTEFEDEESAFAMQIRNEGVNFELLIDKYFSKLFNKNFRFVAIPGSTSFYLKTQGREKGYMTDLVNEGFGVNQTLYMLIKLLKKNTSLAFIEEPEIHLHPSAQNKLVDVFAEIVQNENKQIFLSTHSENIVSSILAKIANGSLDKDDVQFYISKFEDDETKIIPQEINDKGQVEGGLTSFMETELANLKTMLGI